MTHICVGKLTIIGAIQTTSHYLNQCWNIDNLKLWNKFHWNLSKIHIYSFKKMHLNMSSTKWCLFWPQCANWLGIPVKGKVTLEAMGKIHQHDTTTGYNKPWAYFWGYTVQWILFDKMLYIISDTELSSCVVIWSQMWVKYFRNLLLIIGFESWCLRETICLFLIRNHFHVPCTIWMKQWKWK